MWAGGLDARPGQEERDETPAGIYGTIICASVMAAGAGHDVGVVAVTVVVTLLVYWAAERWSEVLADNLGGEPFSWRHARHVFASGWPMVQASYAPIVVMGVAWLLGADDSTAITIALWTSIGLLGLLGGIAARRGGLGQWGMVGSVAFTALLGAVLVVLKALLH